MAYANGLKASNERYIGKSTSTVIASIKNLDIGIEEIAAGAKKAKNIYDLVQGIQISQNKNFVEVIIPDKSMLVTEGLMFQQHFYRL